MSLPQSQSAGRVPKRGFVVRHLQSAGRFLRLQSAGRFLNGRFVRPLLPAGRFLKERLVVRPLQYVGPFLKKGLVVRPLLFAFMIIGGVMIFLGVQEYRRSSSSSSASKSTQATPQTITCKQLAAKGPGDNAYVRLTDFEFTDEYAVRRERSRGSEWQTAYVPAVPPRVKDIPEVRIVRVLVKSDQPRNERALYALSRMPIEGVVVKGISSLGAADQALLRKNYSHLGLDECWILEAGSVPPAPSGFGFGFGGASTGTGGGLGMIGGGTGLACIAAGMLLLAGRRA